MTLIDANLTARLDETDGFWTVALDDDSASDFGGHGASLSPDRCIDWLLDLHQSTADRSLRILIGEVLDDLRAVVEHPCGLAGLGIDDVVLGALASVEAAFEIVGSVSRVD